MSSLLHTPLSLPSKTPTAVAGTHRLFPTNPRTLSFPITPRPHKLTFTTPIRFSRPYPDDPVSGDDDEEPDRTPTSNIPDEWGEKSDPDPEPATKLADSDPPKNDDEWGATSEKDFVVSGNGNVGGDKSDESGSERLEELKRCLVDSVYGTDLGVKASSEVRGEVFELVSQLEALNPIAAPTDAVVELDGNWVLLYTAFSELLPFLAAGTTPFLKVDKICQSISTSNLTIDNTITLSSPFATVSFSALATFEVRSPSRIQVTFTEGSFQPPDIKSSVSLPDNIDIFGQTINLSPVQRSLNPLQEAVAGIARGISGQPPLKVRIPGERSNSWLIITYLDKDLRISRGDGGLFVLAKEGSPLLDQLSG
ncbi:hypothetical protein ACET3Z_008336 [Daucus carota]